MTSMGSYVQRQCRISQSRRERQRRSPNRGHLGRGQRRFVVAAATCPPGSHIASWPGRTPTAARYRGGRQVWVTPGTCRSGARRHRSTDWLRRRGPGRRATSAHFRVSDSSDGVRRPPGGIPEVWSHSVAVRRPEASRGGTPSLADWPGLGSPLGSAPSGDFGAHR